MTEIASDAGFEDITFCKPVTETNVPAVFDAPSAASVQLKCLFPGGCILDPATFPWSLTR